MKYPAAIVLVVIVIMVMTGAVLASYAGTNLTATGVIAVGSSSSGGSGGEGGGMTTGVTFVYDKSNPDGKLIKNVIAYSMDKKVWLVMNAGTLIITSRGAPAIWVSIKPDEESPEPPEVLLVYMPYDLQQNGTTFEPGAMLYFDYSAMAFPPSVGDTEIGLAYFDAEQGEWIALDNISIDAENEIIGGYITHLTTFAVVAVDPDYIVPTPETTPPTTIPDTTPPTTTPPTTEPPTTQPTTMSPTQTPSQTTVPTIPVTQPTTQPPTTYVTDNGTGETPTGELGNEDGGFSKMAITIIAIVVILGGLMVYLRYRALKRQEEVAKPEEDE